MFKAESFVTMSYIWLAEQFHAFPVSVELLTDHSVRLNCIVDDAPVLGQFRPNRFRQSLGRRSGPSLFELIAQLFIGLCLLVQ